MSANKKIVSLAAGVASFVAGVAMLVPARAAADQFMTPTTGEKFDCARAVMNSVAGPGAELKTMVYSSDSFVVRSGENPVVQIQENGGHPNNFITTSVGSENIFSATFSNAGVLHASVKNMNGKPVTDGMLSSADMDGVHKAFDAARIYKHVCSEITVSSDGRVTSGNWHQKLNDLFAPTTEVAADPIAKVTANVNEYAGELLLSAADSVRGFAIEGINGVARGVGAVVDTVRGFGVIANCMVTPNAYAKEIVINGMNRVGHMAQYGMDMMAAPNVCDTVSVYFKDVLRHQMNVNPAPFPYKGLNLGDK